MAGEEGNSFFFFFTFTLTHSYTLLGLRLNFMLEPFERVCHHLDLEKEIENPIGIFFPSFPFSHLSFFFSSIQLLLFPGFGVLVWCGEMYIVGVGNRDIIESGRSIPLPSPFSLVSSTL